ncbi:hypothetical protein K0M31_013928 [Melipona bicolor]|uniref:Uncharacterized protein n=1 Tax=Melipona bicolor TaxID=60889 RepID=A0AA40G884_9HYME|nr:hypothetical protein K0M31_013928 [Melipona bicolor]
MIRVSGERGRGTERKGRIGRWWNDVPGKEMADRSASGTASSPFLSNATRRASSSGSGSGSSSSSSSSSGSSGSRLWENGGGRVLLPVAQVEVEDKPKGVAKNLRAKSAHAIPVGPLVLAFQERAWSLEDGI